MNKIGLLCREGGVNPFSAHYKKLYDYEDK